MKERKIQLIVIAGPTASGKSDIAIQIAKQFNGEIISADSRQVYRGMDIGTGKVAKDKLPISNSQFPKKASELKIAKLIAKNSFFFSEGIRHWLLDVASPRTQYSAARWKKAAEQIIADIHSRGNIPIIAGGTGFYIDGLIYGNDYPAVKPDTKLRVHLEKKTTEQLFTELTRKDARRAHTIDRYNRRRLIRALEIVIKSGSPVPPLQALSSKLKAPYDVLYLAVDMEMEKLRSRIEKRLDSRLRQRMVAEVKHLHGSGVSWKKLESFGLEYRWLARFLQKKITRTEMRDSLLHDIVAYAKRQMTWWRKNEDIEWIKTVTEAKILTKKFLSNR